MVPLVLEGNTLGEKRRHFNKLVEDAIANENYELRNISSNDSDVDNLLKIEIASRNRNVDYIIEVMKSNDMLYAATAIKKSTWLITEPQYAHIINPEYLHTQLLPSMNTKTFNKLMLHIRLNLKDETRVEAFYQYLIGTKNKNSYKWLQNCSFPFLENVIKPEHPIPLRLFKRLCRRSGRCLKLYSRVEEPTLYNAKYEIFCFLKSHTAEALEVLEDFGYFPVVGKKKTKLLMKLCPLRIINNFDRYGVGGQLDLSEVAKYLKKSETKDFLFQQVKYHTNYNMMRPFINNMHEDERFEFVKKTFIDKTKLSEFCTEEDKNWIETDIKPYQWYEFAPFKVALVEIRKLIRAENSPAERSTMLLFLMTCAGTNLQHIKTLLQYFKDKHINEPFKFKIQFVNNLLSQVSTHEFDVETWTILDQLFHSMEVYTESDNKVQICLESITMYKVLHDEPVPKIVEQKMTFNSFKHVQGKLNPQNKSKMFTYLFNSTTKKLDREIITNKSDFKIIMGIIVNALTLLNDWNKDITSYPFLLQKIQELVKIRQENMWKINMSCLYNVKKSWRKHMFEESLSLCLSEEVCLNALKHKPQLLTRHDKEIDTLRTNDAVSLRRLLAKLRVYWPDSLAQHWADAYLLHLNKPTGRAVVRGLFLLLSQNQVIDMAKKYVPDDDKIIWGVTDQADINIRKNIAQNLHVARPLIPLDIILLYAQGDYLQYAVPSVNARLSILSEDEKSEYVSNLMEAPVSLQKFGIDLFLSKLKHDDVSNDDLKSVFLKIWCSTNNLTIRCDIFKYTYARLCEIKNLQLEKDLWKLLSYFIDNLSAEENTDIYRLMGSAENVPISVRAEYYMKSYTFLTSLPASTNCGDFVKNLLKLAPTIMDSLDEQFVVDKLLSPAISKFCNVGSTFITLFAYYVLCSKSGTDQNRKFKKVVDPAINEVFKLWDDENVRSNFNAFLQALVSNLRIHHETLKIPLPDKLFVEIKTKMERSLSLSNNYVLYTSWKLITEYIILLKKKESTFYDSTFDWGWNNTRDRKICCSFAQIIVKCLKKDIQQYDSPTMYGPFTDALQQMFDLLGAGKYFWENTLNYMLSDRKFIPSYLIVAKLLPKYHERERSILHKKIESHQSPIVRIHYRSNLGIWGY